MPFRGGLSERELLGRFHVAPMMLPALVFVPDDLAVGAGSGVNFAYMRGTIIVPPMLVPSHELQAHRLTGQLRQQRRGLRDIVVATVPIGA